MAETEKKKKKPQGKKAEAKKVAKPEKDASGETSVKKEKKLNGQKEKKPQLRKADPKKTREHLENKKRDQLAGQKPLLAKIRRGVQKEISKRKKLVEKLKAAGKYKEVKNPVLKRRQDRRKKQKRQLRRKREKGKRLFVEIGRVVCILHGASRNTLAVIVDIMDSRWVMIDGMCFQQDELGKPSKRKMMNLNDLKLTPFKITIPYRMKSSKIGKILKKAQILKKWKRTSMYKTIQKRREKRWSTDLERWRVQYNRKQRSTLIKAEYLKLKRKVLELAKAAMSGKKGLPTHVLRKGTLPAEQRILRSIHLGLFKEKEKKPLEENLKLFTKPKMSKQAKKAKEAAKKAAKEAATAAKTAAAKPSGKKAAAKAKPKPKAGGAAAKAKPKPAAKEAKPKPAAKDGKDGGKGKPTAAKQPAKKAAAKPEAKAGSKPAAAKAPAKAAVKPAPKAARPSSK